MKTINNSSKISIAANDASVSIINKINAAAKKGKTSVKFINPDNAMSRAFELLHKEYNISQYAKHGCRIVEITL